MATTNYNPIPRDSDENNASEKRYLNTLLSDSNSGFAAAQAAHDKVAPSLFDNFFSLPTLGPWVATHSGTTGNDVPAALLATEPNGAVTFACGTGSLEASELAGRSVSWKPSTMGPLTFEARLKVVGTTEPLYGDFSVGLADAVTFASGTPHIIGASSLYTTDTPVEFAGFHYSSLVTSGTLYPGATATPIGNYIGIKTALNGTGPVAKSSGIRKNSSYRVYKVVVATTGNATFYIDDALVGSVTTAVTPTVALTPYFQVHSSNSKEITMTIDWAGVYATAAV
jgi:hypothetical protein